MMTDRAARVLEEAMSLPRDDRAKVAESLLSSLDTPSQKRIERLWVKEAEARRAAIERGEMKVLPVEEAIEAARKKITR
jgi:putative addiction module component (TIGR02574 family)